MITLGVFQQLQKVPFLLIGEMGFKWLLIFLGILVTSWVVAGEIFEPFNVSYDGRAFIIDGHRRMLISGGIHYPRVVPEMWLDLISKSKEGGVDIIETYVFWNVHEPARGQYNFEGRYDIVEFVKQVGSMGLYVFLRIGPYACAEWNFGGFPVWLRDIPGIEFRTDNKPFKDEMQRFVKKIVNMMREELLLSWQGGPVIILQIENEYGNVESSFGPEGREYMRWAASMAVGLDVGVPWVMCEQADAPEIVINTCNGYYCDGFKPNSNNKPKVWTENWDGWFTSWGDRVPYRPSEDLAFAVARFFQRGGSFQNYYMYFGGTNFGRTAGGPNYVTSYDYDAPIDEYGLLRQPKWGHLKDLHAAIRLCEPALISVHSPKYKKLGPKQEAHVFDDNGSNCAAFLANIDEHSTFTVTFLNKSYALPPWSVSVLPDCRNVAFNTAKIGAQNSVIAFGSDIDGLSLNAPNNYISKSWYFVEEHIGTWINTNFTFNGILEHLNVTKDQSDYLWYTTRVYVSDDDIHFWEHNQLSPMLSIDSVRDLVYIFINHEFKGSVRGKWVRVVHPVDLVQGYNDITLLSQTVGLQNYGAFLEKDGGGFKGQIKLTGFKNGDLNITNFPWTYQVGLLGEQSRFYAADGSKDVEWTELLPDSVPSRFSWYKTYFDAPGGSNPVALDLSSMGKGQAWVNGHHVGRYWTLKAPNHGCQACKYSGAYHSDKCVTNCGEPTQSWYHVPRAWLQPSANVLVLLEEEEKTPFKISIGIRFTETICAQVSENHYPPLDAWMLPKTINGRIKLNSTVAPVMRLQCDSGHTFSSVMFASYGTAHGGCKSFSRGSCHSPNSVSEVSQACLGRQNCSISVSNAVFGDPCRGILKTLSVQLRCSAAAAASRGMSI